MDKRRLAFDKFKDVDVHQFTHFLRDCRRKLPPGPEELPAEYRDLCLQMDLAMNAVYITKDVLLRPQQFVQVKSVQNALRHAVFMCAVAMDDEWTNVLQVMQSAFDRAQKVSVLDWQEGIEAQRLCSLTTKLKEQVQALQIYLSALPQKTKLLGPTVQVDFSAEPIGQGSEGTLVFKGFLQGSPVAVKRVLRTSITPVEKEINLLKNVDCYQNIIRYHCLERCPNFWYIVLDFCPATLEDIILRPDQHPDIVASFDPKRALREILTGVYHLHRLDIAHRDIKPTNVLVSRYNKGGLGGYRAHQMLISDFGLCKTLGDVEEISRGPVRESYTRGWCAPEVIRNEVKLDKTTLDLTHAETRLQKAIDVFALGLLSYFIFTRGGHPFGRFLERNHNILTNNYTFKDIHQSAEDKDEIIDLVSHMLNAEARSRPNMDQCYMHPLFWDASTRMHFLHGSFEHFHQLPREPKSPELIALEEDAITVIGPDWLVQLDQCFAQSLEEARFEYDRQSIQDLLRVFRYHWFLPPAGLKTLIGHSVAPIDYVAYFGHRFPRLLIHVHRVIANSPVSHKSEFLPYFVP